MPDRIVRAGLLESDRWLDLRDNTERLSYVAVLLKADDLGTLDATDGALVRLWSGPCNVRSREEAVAILEALRAQDLVRVYTAGGKRYIFIPRFRQRFRARTLKRPAPPAEILADEPAVLSNLNEIKARTEKMPGNCPQPAGNGQASAPVVVVEGVVEGEEKTAPASPPPEPAEQDFFITGRRFLTANGVPEKDARGLLGKIRKELGDDAAAKLVADLIAVKPSEPCSWLAAAITARRTGRRRSTTPAKSRPDLVGDENWNARFGRA